MNIYNDINWDTNSLATILYIEIDIHIYAVVLKIVNRSCKEVNSEFFCNVIKSEYT